jgi:hypothetical protein
MPASRGVAVALVSLLVALAVAAATVSPGLANTTVGWPPSSGLLLAEVLTGGVSASDEYVEIANSDSVAQDLGGCELVYVTASGATTTRKAAFESPLILEAGRHLLVANSAGIYGQLADEIYSGGLAGDGGSLVLRLADGSVVDAVGWGSATNVYVETAPAPAPPAGSSLERRPGGAEGNTTDTNDNAADWFIQPSPVPQSLASDPTPGDPVGSAEATLPGTATATAAATTTAAATGTPGATASASPTEPEIDLESIASARSRAIGERVRVGGVVTAAPGFTGTAGLLSIGDSSGGIFVRLTSSDDGLEVGRSVELVGTLASPYSQLEVREIDWLALGATGAGPEPTRASLEEIGEQLEGSLVTATGTVDSVQTDNGRLSVVIGDGQRVLRVLADAGSGLSKSDITRGSIVSLTGVLGQRATATGRLDGYRLWLRSRADLHLEPMPQGSGSAAPSGTPVLHDLATALAVRGSRVEVTATVTAPVGVIEWGGPTIVIDDGTAAVAVVVPSGTPALGVGARVRVAGKVGSYKSGPRVVATLVEPTGELQLVEPLEVRGALGATLEWRLVRVSGRIERVTRVGDRWRADLLVGGQPVAVVGGPAAGIPVAAVQKGHLAVVIGIVRRSTSDSSKFQLLPRSKLDFRLGPAVAVTTSSTPDSSGGAVPDVVGSAAIPRVEIDELSDHLGGLVVTSGLIVEVGPGEATLDDGTGRVRLGGLDAAESLSLLELGDAVEVTGRVDRDELGWLIEIDPDRIVVLSGGAGGAGATAAITADVSGGSIGTGRAATPVAGSLALQSRVGWRPPDYMPLLVVALFAVTAVGAAAMAWAARQPQSRLGRLPRELICRRGRVR